MQLLRIVASFAQPAAAAAVVVGVFTVCTPMDVWTSPKQQLAGSVSACAAGACDVILTRVARLSTGPGVERLPNGSVHVARDSRGRLILRSADFRSLLLFKPSGEFIGAASRPGGFKAIGSFVLGPADRIWLHDYRARQVHVLSADLAVERTMETTYAPSIVRVDGTWIIGAQIQTPELIGYPVHLASGDGIVVRSFGIDVPQYRSDLRLVTTRRVAPASDGTIWAIAPGRYALERWNPSTGRLLRRVQVPSVWFRESTNFPRDERERPNALVESLWEQDGLVWVLFRDADAAWQPPKLANVERAHDPDEYAQTYDWILEAVEPEVGQVVASRRFGEPLWARAPPLLASLGDKGSTDEVSSIELWSAGLRRREQ